MHGSHRSTAMFIRRHWAVVVAAVACLGLVSGGVALAGSKPSASSTNRSTFAPTTCWKWVDGPSLGTGRSADQWASATVSGLLDGDHNAGFRLRNGSGGTILVAVSATGWRIEPSAAPIVTGAATIADGGILRAAVSSDDSVTISYNGVTLTTQKIAGDYTGRGIAATVWQSTARVRMTHIRSSLSRASASSGAQGPSSPAASSSAAPASASPTTTSSAAPTATTTSTKPPATGARWYSGAASKYAADGSYGTWRGEPVTVGGTWDDSLEEQTALDSLSADWKSWTGILDDAIGAIWKPQGETWAKAAAGAYDQRWAQSLTNLKAKWGGRDQSNLYLRFAHELNGDWSDWSVVPGEEADFRAALTRFSNLRYQIIPKAHVVLCTNDGTSSGIDLRKLFVATDSQNRRVVDVYATDSYNEWPHRTSYQDIMQSFSRTDDNGAPVGIEAHRAFAQSVGVPFAIPEWSNCGIQAKCGGGGGEATEYVRALNDWARSHAGDVTNPVAGQLLYEVQFNLWEEFLLYPNSAQPATSKAYADLVWGR